jgi:hypothetical protein
MAIHVHESAADLKRGFSGLGLLASDQNDSVENEEDERDRKAGDPSVDNEDKQRGCI